MRGAVSLGYLLARTSDTVADSAGVSGEVRMECLMEFGRCIEHGEAVSVWPDELVVGVSDAGELRLMERTDEVLRCLDEIPPGEAALVREVVAVIIGGQKLDLERFCDAGGEAPQVLEDDADLDDYTWRVAGCVGAFWTKLGILTMGGGFSHAPEGDLLEMGVRYGKGLQLVNILRDLPADLAAGRCYLPVDDARDIDAMMTAHARWVEVAWEWVGAGFDYAATLESRRLRAATVLPAMIARETLESLRGADWETLQTRVKVPRKRVYLALVRAFVGCVRA